MTRKVVSHQIADSIDVKQLSAALKAELYYSDPSELFYKTGPEQFVYIFKYGAVCFLNYEPAAITEFLQQLTPYCKMPFPASFTDDFLVETNSKDVKVGFNQIEIPLANIDVLRLVMLNVAQSAALDYYEEQTNRLLEETNIHTQRLANKGRLDISDRKLKQFIGSTLLLRNRIAENIYVLDSPPETWEDESLNRINNELKRTFDLQVRVRATVEGLAIIRDNLELFRALLQHRYSNILEWINILLILIEVINLGIEKLF